MQILQGKPVPKTEVIKWKSADGREIEGLLTYPLNYMEGKKYPLILNIHGGPAGVFIQSFYCRQPGSLSYSCACRGRLPGIAV
jgi:dipeptidyl aminopeptidase/acylaminoacyl peptidase